MIIACWKMSEEASQQIYSYLHHSPQQQRLSHKHKQETAVEVFEKK